MAVAAFKSTSKRTQVVPTRNNASSISKGRSDPSSQKGAHRRSSSLSDFSQHVPEISSPADSFQNIQIDVGSRRDNPLFQSTSPVRERSPCHSDNVNTIRGSSALEKASRLLQQSKEDLKCRRGRSLSRSQGGVANGSQAETEHGQRRGRSVSRHQSCFSQSGSNQKVQVDSGRRGRSLSRCMYSDSESDMDPICNRIGQGQHRNLGTVDRQRYSPNNPHTDWCIDKQGLKRCSSQQDFSRYFDSYSSCVSSLSDNECSAMPPNECIEEKTIRSVYEQMKSLRSDHPTGDTDSTGIYETIRSEVWRAVSEIRSDLEQAISRKNPSTATSTRLSNSSQSKDTDADLVSAIKEEYAAKLDQAEIRARNLWAQLAVEEQRCQELSRILKELPPDPQTSQTQKKSVTRKNSAERKQISKGLTEEAQNYFEEFVSISTLEDAEMSSLEEVEKDSSVEDMKMEENGCYRKSTPDISCSNLADDGLIIPWLKCETNSHHNAPVNREKSDIASTGRKIQQDIAKEERSSSSCGSSSGSGRNVHVTNTKRCTGNWSTNGRSLQNKSNFSPKSTESKLSLSTGNPTERKKKHEIKNNMRSIENTSEEGRMKSSTVQSSSSYQDDEYLLHVCNEAVLTEMLKLKNSICFGGLLLCSNSLI